MTETRLNHPPMRRQFARKRPRMDVGALGTEAPEGIGAGIAFSRLYLVVNNYIVNIDLLLFTITCG